MQCFNIEAFFDKAPQGVIFLRERTYEELPKINLSMAKVTFSPVMAKLSEFGSTSIFEATFPKRGKTEFVYNSKHRLLMVFDADDTNPHCRHKRFAEFRIPSDIPLNQLTTSQLLAACVRLPFQEKNGRNYGGAFVRRINRACIGAYAKALGLIEGW